MEISSFETTAFSRRQIDKLDARSRSPLRFVVSSLSPAIGFVGLIVLIVFLFGNSNGYLPTGHIVTPGRLLVIMTILLIILTPYVRSRSRVSSARFTAQSVATKPVTGFVEPPRTSFEPPKPSVPALGQGFNRLSADVLTSLAPVPSRFDISQQTGFSSRRSSGGHAPAPFLDDVNASLKHEYTSSLPLWSRRLEDTLIMPMIVKPLVEELEESDKLITRIFQHYGAKLAQEPAPGTSKLDSSQISLSDRYLPHPMSADPQVVNIWQKRQMLEAALNIPSFPRHYRDSVFARISTWARRGGIRFAYRHDQSEDDEGPTDSHILAHVVFSALDSIIGHHQHGFRERYVVSSSGTATSSSGDDFNSLFFSLANNSKLNAGGVHQHCKIVWLEEVVVAGPSNRRGQPALHYNVATNQRVYGVQGGGGNLIEALSLFFHLLKQLSPSAMWVQLPHNLRMILEAAVGGGSDSGTGSLTGSFFTSFTNPALGAPPFRGF